MNLRLLEQNMNPVNEAKDVSCYILLNITIRFRTFCTLK